MRIDKIIARAFGEGDAEEQGAHLNSLGRALWNSCLRHRNIETQFCYISDELDVDGKRLVTELAAFLALDEKS